MEKEKTIVSGKKGQTCCSLALIFTLIQKQPSSWWSCCPGQGVVPGRPQERDAHSRAVQRAQPHPSVASKGGTCRLIESPAKEDGNICALASQRPQEAGTPKFRCELHHSPCNHQLWLNSCPFSFAPRPKRALKNILSQRLCPGPS